MFLPDSSSMLSSRDINGVHTRGGAVDHLAEFSLLTWFVRENQTRHTTGLVGLPNSRRV